LEAQKSKTQDQATSPVFPILNQENPEASPEHQEN